MNKNIKIITLILLSLIPLAFLIYSLINLNHLEISIFHPRIIIEYSIFVILIAIAVVLFIRKSNI